MKRRMRQHPPTVYSSERISSVIRVIVYTAVMRFSTLAFMTLLTGCSAAIDQGAEEISRFRAGDSSVLAIAGTPVTDRHLKSLRGLHRISTLRLQQANITLEGLACLREEPLTEVVLENCPVDDAMLRELCRHHNLRVLNLPDSVVTNAGLVAIEQLDHLELLRLGSRHVTDAGMVSITRLPSLRWLILVNVPITDDGLETLRSLWRLESLYLLQSDVTERGLARLQEARPSLHLHWE